MNQLLLGSAISALITSAGLLAYDRFAARPPMVIGVVDVSEVYRQKESEVSSRLAASRSEDEKRDVMASANAFAKRLPVAIDELPADCHCVVMLRSAIAGRPAGARDLTPLLKAKLEAAR